MKRTMNPAEWPPARVSRKCPLTPYSRGWKKWINGRSRHVCGKIPEKQAVDRYHERLERGEFGRRKNVKDFGDDGVDLVQLANLWVSHLRQRVDTGRPRKLASVTYDDYRRAAQLLVDVVREEWNGGMPFAVEIRPLDFSAYVARVPGKSPNTLHRYVVAVKAMYAYGVDNDLIPHPVKFGSDLVSPSADELRQNREKLDFTFTAEEIRRLLSHADAERRAWLLLGLNAGFHNIDFARFEHGHMTEINGQPVAQLGRLKKGLSARRATLWPETVAAVKAAKRVPPVDPAHGDLIFLTRYGRPWVRRNEKRSVQGGLLEVVRDDNLAKAFRLLKEEAEVGTPKPGSSQIDYGDGRGFKGLRTTLRTLFEQLPPADRDEAAINRGVEPRSAAGPREDPL